MEFIYDQKDLSLLVVDQRVRRISPDKPAHLADILQGFKKFGLGPFMRSSTDPSRMKGVLSH